MVDSPNTSGGTASGPMARAAALRTATRFVRDEGQAPPVVLDSGRVFVLDVFSREWHVVFEAEADPYLALLTGTLQPRYRRVAVHAETGECRWIDDEASPTG